MKKKIILLILLGSCLAVDVSKEDVNRVKKHFLELRFQATMNPELANLKDIDLFQLSCKNQRVNCKRVLEILKKEDNEFYRKLISQ